MSILPWAVFAAASLPVLTVGLAKFSGGGYDNRLPRDWAGSLHGFRQRAYAAHLNHYEFFPFFAAAALFAEIRLKDAGFVGVLALAILVFRLVYTGAYLADRSNLRSLAWFAAWIGTALLFSIAAIGA